MRINTVPGWEGESHPKTHARSDPHQRQTANAGSKSHSTTHNFVDCADLKGLRWNVLLPWSTQHRVISTVSASSTWDFFHLKHMNNGCRFQQYWLQLISLNFLLSIRKTGLITSYLRVVGGIKSMRDSGSTRGGGPGTHNKCWRKSAEHSVVSLVPEEITYTNFGNL